MCFATLQWKRLVFIGFPQGAKVYSGLYNGNIQVWHMDAYVNLPSGSRPGEFRVYVSLLNLCCCVTLACDVFSVHFSEYHTLSGHTSSVYALVVTDRQVRHDSIFFWNSVVDVLGIRACMLWQLISASHDKMVKMWDLNTLRCRHTLKVQSLGKISFVCGLMMVTYHSCSQGHNSRVRALALAGKLLFSGTSLPTPKS